MINVEELGARIILGFGEGKLFITESTLFGLVIAVILAVLGIWLGSGLKTVPKGKQVVAEFIVGWVYKFTENNMGKENKSYAPYVGSILGFVFCASCLGAVWDPSDYGGLKRGVCPVRADVPDDPGQLTEGARGQGETQRDVRPVPVHVPAEDPGGVYITDLPGPSAFREHPGRVHRNRTVAASDDAPKQHDYDGPVSACGYGTAAECDL